MISKVSKETELSFDQSNLEKPQAPKENPKEKKPSPKESFETTNEFVEKWSRIGIFLLNRVVVLFIICPKIIVSFFIYFTTDLGYDAFDLPLPMW